MGAQRDAAVRHLRGVLVTYAILTIQNPEMWGDDVSVSRRALRCWGGRGRELFPFLCLFCLRVRDLACRLLHVHALEKHACGLSARRICVYARTYHMCMCLVYELRVWVCFTYVDVCLCGHVQGVYMFLLLRFVCVLLYYTRYVHFCVPWLLALQFF